jgi:hypothetical protein
MQGLNRPGLPNFQSLEELQLQQQENYIAKLNSNQHRTQHFAMEIKEINRKEKVRK